MSQPIRLKLLATIGLGLSCMLLNGCHSSAAKRAFSPLIGSWHINGDSPQPDANMPRFTALVFRRGGSLEASYVAAGGALAGVLKNNAKTGEEHDTYTLVGANTLKIIEGSRALDYTYDVRDGKLFLKSAGSDTPTVFIKTAEGESGVSGDSHAPTDGTDTENTTNSTDSN